jgi:hypothetical protein
MRLKVARGDQRQLGVHSNHELSRAGCNGALCSIGVHLLPPPWHRDCACRHRPSRLATKRKVAAELRLHPAGRQGADARGPLC